MKANPYTPSVQQNREEQLLKYAPKVKRIVKYMAMRFPPGVDEDDITQAGMLGLLDAVDKFDTARDVNFGTYAEFRIRGAILDELRTMDWVPRSVRTAATEWGTNWQQLSSELGRTPSDHEMARKMEMSITEYHKFLSKASPVSVKSFEEISANLDDNDGGDLLEILITPDTPEDPFANLSVHQVKDQIAKIIEHLKEQEQLVLSLYYNEEMNLREIGEILGLRESRISQIHTKAILKIRAHLNRQRNLGI